MAVIARKRAEGRVTYYVCVRWRGKKHWENAGTDKREAVRLNARRKAEIKSGTFHPKLGAETTVRTYAEAWIERRKNRNADNDASVLRRLVMERDFGALKMDDVRPRHVAQLLADLRAVKSDATGGRLSEKYIANVIGLLSTMFRTAKLEEVVLSNPCELPRGAIKRRSSASKARAPYALDAIVTVLGCEEVPLVARVFAALAFYTGMREGEICGRRWRDWDRGSEPLGCLTVATQYDDQPLKTDEDGDERPRRIPVHPDLDELLDWWWNEGFALQYAKPPTVDGFIVPRRGGANHTRSSAYKMFRRALDSAGVANQTLHATRHSFITHCRRGGARKDVLEKVTHNAAGDIVDQYTHFDWAPLCEAVLCLNVRAGLTRGVTRPSEALSNRPDRGGGAGNRTRQTERNSSKQHALTPLLGGRSGGDVSRGFGDHAAKGAARSHLESPADPTVPEHLRDVVIDGLGALAGPHQEAVLEALGSGAEAIDSGDVPKGGAV